MFYFVKTPKWLPLLYPNRNWEMDTNKKEIYLTFDNGYENGYTAQILDVLKKVCSNN